MAIMGDGQAGEVQPPQPGQDHKTRIEIYAPIAQIFQAVGQAEIAQALQELIMLQQELLEQEEAKKKLEGAKGLLKGVFDKDKDKVPD